MLLDEHLRVKGRATWYESVKQIQKDLDAYIETYNRNRPHRGPRLGGANAVSGLHERDPRAQEPEEVSEKGDADRSLKR